MQSNGCRTSVPSFFRRCDRRRLLLALCLTVALAGCTLNEAASTNILIAPVSDVSPLTDGICFEAAHAMSGQVYILTEQSQLDAVYDQIDGSGLCRHRMMRQTFDFSGRTVVGTWTYAPQGCTARHDQNQLWRDDAARTLTLGYRFAVEGDCPYELIRPLWVAVQNPGGYMVTLEIHG